MSTFHFFRHYRKSSCKTCSVWRRYINRSFLIKNLSFEIQLGRWKLFFEIIIRPLVRNTRDNACEHGGHGQPLKHDDVHDEGILQNGKWPRSRLLWATLPSDAEERAPTLVPTGVAPLCTLPWVSLTCVIKHERTARGIFFRAINRRGKLSRVACSGKRVSGRNQGVTNRVNVALRTGAISLRR